MLTDEIIAQLWYESGNQVYKFARLVEAWVTKNSNNSQNPQTGTAINTLK